MLRKGKKRTFLDIRGEVLPGGEQGLLSVAFAPDYQQSGLLYVYYVSNAGDLAIEEYRRASATSADRSSARRVLTINHPGESNHNGGQLQFGRTASSSTSARATAGAAATRTIPPRKPRACWARSSASIPAPAAATPTARPARTRSSETRDATRSTRWGCETRSLQLRPRLAQGPHIVIGDVGQDRFEEIDYETVAGARGANFGWNDFEGNSAFRRQPPAPSRHDRPIKVYSLGSGLRADRRLRGGLKKLKSVRGRYLYGDFCLGKLRSLVPEQRREEGSRAWGPGPVAELVRAGTGGSVYATSLNGPVFKLVGKRKGR